MNYVCLPIHCKYLHVYVYMVIFSICTQNCLVVGYDGLKGMKPTWRPIMQQRWDINFTYEMNLSSRVPESRPE